MQAVFLDTSYLLALELARDQHHARALQYQRSLAGKQPAIVTSSFVLEEIATFLNSRGFHSQAVAAGNQILYSSDIQVVYVEETLLERSWTYFQQHTDKRYSLTDCTSFVIMDDLQISHALTFDKHFIQAGFKTLPERT